MGGFVANYLRRAADAGRPVDEDLLRPMIKIQEQ